MRNGKTRIGRVVVCLLLLLVVVFAVLPVMAEGGDEAAAAEVVTEAAETAEIAAEEAEEAVAASPYVNTFWALVPALIAIILALISKEVYFSLFFGIVAGGLLLNNFHLENTMNRVFSGGFVGAVTDTYNLGILVFLVLLGMMVAMMNKAGGSAAFGRWAQTHIKTRVGAQLATIALGVFIFIDDYFNCLTVGSVMRPVTDKHKVSRAKLAYLIDATAAPICIIAPISSWAAAVSGFAEDGIGFSLFTDAIPYNFYALLTIAMMIAMVLLKVDYGPMARYERNAKSGDLFSGKNPYASAEAGEQAEEAKGKISFLLLPVVLLIVFCAAGMLYTGGFFSGVPLRNAFADADASIGLMLGSFFAIACTTVYFLVRKAMKFKDIMECLPNGFKAMVPAILILIFAWTLKNITMDLGAKEYVDALVRSSAGSFQNFLPAIIFLIAVGLSFSTGTSWGTFGMLIPIVQSVFTMDNPLAIICVSACMAGAVCGDHCSPISDTTIMSSAGAQCDHVNHVNTQLPYAMTCAGVSFVTYILAGFAPSWFPGIIPWCIALPVGVTLMVLTVVIIRLVKGKEA